LAACRSAFGLFGHLERVVDFDAEISNCTTLLSLTAWDSDQAMR
jgi:hypothetical protein